MRAAAFPAGYLRGAVAVVTSERGVRCSAAVICVILCAALSALQREKMRAERDAQGGAHAILLPRRDAAPRAHPYGRR